MASRYQLTRARPGGRRRRCQVPCCRTKAFLLVAQGAKSIAGEMKSHFPPCWKAQLVEWTSLGWPPSSAGLGSSRPLQREGPPGKTKSRREFGTLKTCFSKKANTSRGTSEIHLSHTPPLFFSASLSMAQGLGKARCVALHNSSFVLLKRNSGRPALKNS